MASIWIVSEDRVLPGTLAYHLGTLGDVATGPPESGAFSDHAAAPDLLVLVATDEPSGELVRLERLLEFVRGIEAFRRAAPPVLYVEPAGRHPSAPLALTLIDDRPARAIAPPLDPSELLEVSADLLDSRSVPPSLRERARRDWVTERVARYYAGVDLASLRHAIDPRNARRPVLLIGEPGTGCGLLARYVHTLAEPVRERLVMIPAHELISGRVEAQLIERTWQGRVTVYIDHLSAASEGVQQELAHALGQSGLLGIETTRWIASCVRSDRISSALRRLAWLEVQLPALRQRLDVGPLLTATAQAFCERTGRRIEIEPEAFELLTHYAWPGNLAELESVIDSSMTRARGDVLRAEDLTIGVGPRSAAAPPTPEPEPEHEHAHDEPPDAEPEPEPEAEAGGVRFESGEPIDLGTGDVPTTPDAEPDEPDDASDAPEPHPRAREPEIGEIVAPLSQEVREPLLAVRTYANLLDQRPDDENVRSELAALVEGDLGRVEESLRRLEQFAAFGDPTAGPVDLGALVMSEIDRRRDQMRERALVMLEEVERSAAPALVDEAQLRFALAGLLDRALRMVPDGGDLYVGSLHRTSGTDGQARHRILIRFHSPEDVLVAPEGVPGPPMPLEVVLARSLITRMGGAFAVDASGAQDNVILIELPA